MLGCSDVGTWWHNWDLLGISTAGSVQLALVTQTNDFTQSVGSSTFAMMPCSISASSSLLRGARSASGTRHGGWMTGGTVGSRVMRNSPWKHPIPWKQSWYWQRSSDFASALPCGSGIGAVSVCVVEVEVEVDKLHITTGWETQNCWDYSVHYMECIRFGVVMVWQGELTNVIVRYGVTTEGSNRCIWRS